MKMLMCKTKKPEDKKEAAIKKYMPFITYTAYRLSINASPHMTTDDLVSAGLIGLTKAIDKFKPGEARQKAYAEIKIKYAMIDELRASAWLPRSMKVRINEIEKARTKLEKKLCRMPEDAEVAKHLNMPMDKYFKTRSYAAASNMKSIEELNNVNHPDIEKDILECIADPNAKNPFDILEEKEKRKKLKKLLNALPKHQRQVLFLYYFEDLTLSEVGKVLKVTESRVCQIHRIALGNLKSMIDQSCSLAA